MRADCEVRVGTVSEGMSRLARLVLLQRGGVCLRGFILELRFHVGGLSLWLSQCFCPKGVSLQEAKEPYQTVKA